MTGARQALISLLVICLHFLLASPAAAQSMWPNESPEQWGLAIVDVETTGLDPAFNEMVDLGIIYTDIEGNTLGEFFLRIMPNHPERTAPQAAAINGFSVERWNALGAVTPDVAVAQFLAFHNQMSEKFPGADGSPRIWLLTGYNIWFDRGFLDALLLQHGSAIRDIYHYFQLDLPSQAWGLGITGLRGAAIADALGIAPETDDPLQHTGASGADWNLQVYLALRALATHQAD